MASNQLLGVFFDFNNDLLNKACTICKLHKINHIRISGADISTLGAFYSMKINIYLDIPNFMLMGMATNNSAVEDWFNKNIKAFAKEFYSIYIVVGQEADENILPVMKILQNLVNENFLSKVVKLTTMVSYTITLVVKSPAPSSGTFYPDLIDNMRDILKFLQDQGYPLMVSVYPYQKYVEDNTISESYATFGTSNPVVRDGSYDYYNLFDAMVDTFYAAMEKVGAKEVSLIVGETGWPRCGHNDKATIALASVYNQKLKTHINYGKGTPRKPNAPLQTFIRSLFDEEQQSCYGVFDNMTLNPIYPLF